MREDTLLCRREADGNIPRLELKSLFSRRGRDFGSLKTIPGSYEPYKAVSRLLWWLVGYRGWNRYDYQGRLAFDEGTGLGYKAL